MEFGKNYGQEKVSIQGIQGSRQNTLGGDPRKIFDTEGKP